MLGTKKRLFQSDEVFKVYRFKSRKKELKYISKLAKKNKLILVVCPVWLRGKEQWLDVGSENPLLLLENNKVIELKCSAVIYMDRKKEVCVLYGFEACYIKLLETSVITEKFSHYFTKQEFETFKSDVLDARNS